MSWHEQARCAPSARQWALDPEGARLAAEAFFPLSGETARAERAKRVCDGCPVRSRCLEEALAAGHDVGIWGGLDPEQRRVLRRARADRGAAA